MATARLAALALVLAGALAAGCAAREDRPGRGCPEYDISEEATLVTGRVTDAEGAPLAGATVTAARPGAADVAAGADEAGCYKLEVTPGVWTVRAHLAGYEARSATTDDLQPPREQRIDFVLSRGG